MGELRDISKNCRIYIDKEGKWFYEGREIIHPHILNVFYSALEMDSSGRYRIIIHPELCYIEVEDTPFVVVSVSGNREDGYTIYLNNAQAYALDPSQLWVKNNNVLYTKLPNGMEVRFSRPAYYRLALDMEEDSGDIVLRVGNKTYKILPHRE